MVPEFGHLLLQRHQGPADLFDLVVGERAIIHPPQRLPLHQLAEQLDDREDQGHQALLDRLRVCVNAMAPYRRALLPRCHGTHQPGTSSSSLASLIRALAEVTSARSETLTMSTSAMASVTSPLTTTPPASTRSRWPSRMLTWSGSRYGRSLPRP